MIQNIQDVVQRYTGWQGNMQATALLKITINNNDDHSR